MAEHHKIDLFMRCGCGATFSLDAIICEAYDRSQFIALSTAWVAAHKTCCDKEKPRLADDAGNRGRLEPEPHEAPADDESSTAAETASAGGEKPT